MKKSKGSGRGAKRSYPTGSQSACCPDTTSQNPQVRPGHTAGSSLKTVPLN